MKVLMFIGVLLVPFLSLLSLKTKPLEGETIFSTNCAACHTIGSGDLAGPDLKGVTDRRSEDWLIRFIQSPKKLIKKGDPAAVELYNQYNQLVMPDQRLTDEQIKEVLSYIRSQG